MAKTAESYVVEIDGVKITKEFIDFIHDLEGDPDEVRSEANDIARHGLNLAATASVDQAKVDPSIYFYLERCHRLYYLVSKMCAL